MDEEKVYKPVQKHSSPLSPKFVVALVIVLLIVFAASTSFFVVDQTEQAVVLRLGKYLKTTGPGLQTKLPFGIDQNYNVPTQIVQTLTFGYVEGAQHNSKVKLTEQYNNQSVMLTGDLNIVDVEWIVQYKINDPKKWLFNVEDKTTTIRDISQSVMNALVGDLPILSVMTNLRTQIEIDAQQNMQKIFDGYDFGIQIVTVKLQNIVPPEGPVQDAFEDVNKAIQDMNRFINEGKEFYNQQIPEADGEAAKIILQAQGYASERVNNAIGDAARFDAIRESYNQSKETTGYRLYIETMNDILKGQNITLVDKELSNVLPMLNLGGTK